MEAGSKAGIRKKKLAVFVSGAGKDFKAINEGCVGGSIHGDVVIVVANHHDSRGAKYAKENGIPVIIFPRSDDEPNALTTDEVLASLRKYKVDFVLLAGFLKLVPAEIVQAYEKAMLSVHPSLLPAFGGKGHYGIKVHEEVIASGARFSGPTVYFVDENYDTGLILAQRVVPVKWNDTPEDLSARVNKEEHDLFVEVAAALCEERVIFREDGVPFIRSKDNPNEFH